MGKNIVQRIIDSHLVNGRVKPGEEIGIRIDQALTQDATGTMAYLQFEAMDVPRVQCELAVSYVDHNMLQTGTENMDDHLFLQDMAAKYGAYFSRPGNGICHQCHLERFAVPGKTLLGSDSHTPTGGGIGMLAIGAGGLDVAVALGGGPFHLTMPSVVRVWLKGKLRSWVSAKDVILELLRRLSVKGGVGKIFEYAGPGVKHLSVPQRATITNMGAELGVTTSIFPSDERTREFLRAQRRASAWKPLAADEDAKYDETIELDLGELGPLVAKPHSPDHVVPVEHLEGKRVDQVCIGSCTNSSYRDLMMAARMVRGRKIAANVSLTVSPGSKQVLAMVNRDGGLGDLIAAGARILEVGCGPCIGMGQTPATGGVSLRTFNRNFLGRCGSKDASVYLCGSEVAAASALAGAFADPRKLGRPPRVVEPKQFLIDDAGVIAPPRDGRKTKVRRGPNIKPLPRQTPLPNRITGTILLRTGDNVTTDDIMPAGPKILPLRSNIPAMAEFVFSALDESFAVRAKREKMGMVLGGENYGQGSSREHAALAPMYLGVRVVLAKSFARIHRSNLINFGILPLTFVSATDYDPIAQGDQIQIRNLRSAVRRDAPFAIRNVTKRKELMVAHGLSQREKEVLLEGGLLNYTKNMARRRRSDQESRRDKKGAKGNQG